MLAKAYEITSERLLRRLDPELIDGSWDSDNICRWIDVSDIKIGDVGDLLDKVNIALPLGIRESVCRAQTRPRMIPTEEVLFVSMPVFSPVGVPVYLTTICASTTIVTIQSSTESVLDYPLYFVPAPGCVRRCL